MAKVNNSANNAENNKTADEKAIELTLEQALAKIEELEAMNADLVSEVSRLTKQIEASRKVGNANNVITTPAGKVYQVLVKKFKLENKEYDASILEKEEGAEVLEALLKEDGCGIIKEVTN